MISESLKFRDALPSETKFLSELALRSKAHWGYSRQFIESCREELTIRPERIGDEDYQCIVALESNSIVGFYALRAVSRDAVELDALFVEPRHIGTGVGRSLIQHAIRRLSPYGVRSLVIQGDPNATKFYLAAGARQIGQRESESVKNRFLPLFEIDLAAT